MARLTHWHRVIADEFLWWENKGDDGGWPLEHESYQRVRDAVRRECDLSIGRVR